MPQGFAYVRGDKCPPPHRQVQEVPALRGIGFAHDAIDLTAIEQIGLTAETLQLRLRQPLERALKQFVDRYSETLFAPGDQVSGTMPLTASFSTNFKIPFFTLSALGIRIARLTNW